MSGMDIKSLSTSEYSENHPELDQLSLLIWASQKYIYWIVLCFDAFLRIIIRNILMNFSLQL